MSDASETAALAGPDAEATRRRHPPWLVAQALGIALGAWAAKAIVFVGEFPAIPGHVTRRVLVELGPGCVALGVCAALVGALRPGPARLAGAAAGAVVALFVDRVGPVLQLAWLEPAEWSSQGQLAAFDPLVSLRHTLEDWRTLAAMALGLLFSANWQGRAFQGLALVGPAASLSVAWGLGLSLYPRMPRSLPLRDAARGAAHIVAGGLAIWVCVLAFDLARRRLERERDRDRDRDREAAS